MTGRIYKLVCPETKNPLYVGSTTKSLKTRLNWHLSDIKSSKSPIYLHLREKAIKPEIELLEEVEVETIALLRNREADWIRNIGQNGKGLLNYGYNVKQGVTIGIDVRIEIQIRTLFREKRISREFCSAAVNEIMDIVEGAGWGAANRVIPPMLSPINGSGYERIDVDAYNRSKTFLGKSHVMDFAFYTGCLEFKLGHMGIICRGERWMPYEEWKKKQP